jgi:hypothetical protein
MFCKSIINALIFSCPFCLFSANQTLARGDYFLSRKKGNWLQRLVYGK